MLGNYFVVIYQTETGYSAHSPDVPGCVATGSTIEETKQNIQDALEFHFEGMIEDMEEIPKPQPVMQHLNHFADADYFTQVAIQLEEIVEI